MGFANVHRVLEVLLKASALEDRKTVLKQVKDIP